ncbi:hypothetical protein [Reinekea sp.]|jgi:hypothetical protein|uniref:hypothetical protein n=1 Tax=Reinekea sp. TaxID=1970455 RepID=UPI002A83ECD5|nr:hypothetical protein [Reinekea sp.]
MQLLTLTEVPTVTEQQFFQQLLTTEDVLLLTGRALPMIYRAKPWLCRAVVRQVEIDKLGGQPHADWTAIDDARWVELSALCAKTMVW